MTATILSICNRALAAAGTRTQIQNINEGTIEANTCALLYAPTFEALGRTAHWNCLRKQAPLTLLAAAAGTPENANGTGPLPPFPYLYQYAIPSDCLQMQGLIPTLPSAGGTSPLMVASNICSPRVSARRAIPYKKAYATDSQNNPISVLLTNLPQAQAVYTVNQPNPVIWDSSLQQAMVSSLAVFIVTPLTLNTMLMAKCQKEAEVMIAQARVADGNEGVTVIDNIPDWMRARQGGGWEDYDGTDQFGGYAPMVWPGGSTF